VLDDYVRTWEELVVVYLKFIFLVNFILCQSGNQVPAQYLEVKIRSSLQLW
jgi:hypothetical protein